MGLYTQLVVKAELKEGTPKEILETLKYLVDENMTRPADISLHESCESILLSSSAYFKDSEPSFKYHKETNRYVLVSNSSFKNYDAEIESFLTWLKPHIKTGLLTNGSYAEATPYNSLTVCFK